MNIANPSKGTLSLQRVYIYVVRRECGECKPYTSRKLGFGHRAIFTLVPVQSRTGTNVSIGPGSCGQGPAGPRGGIGPGSSGPFGPGWWDKPGPMGHAPGPPPFSPGSYHKPGLKGWS